MAGSASIGAGGSKDKPRDGFPCSLGSLSHEDSGERIGMRVISSTARHNDRKEYIHMGDKGGKKDKAKSKQQHDIKQKADAKRNQEKSPRKTS